MGTINGTQGNDVLLGIGDGFYGNEGTDTINGLGGDDTIDGRGGTDTLNGGDGDDTFLVTTLDNKLSSYDGGSGYDTISFASISQSLYQGYYSGYQNGAINLYDSAGRVMLRLFQGQIVNIEKLVLGSGDDGFYHPGQLSYIDGGPGNDNLTTDFDPTHAVTLSGGEGSDVLQGYYSDTLLGGAGNDQLIVGYPAGYGTPAQDFHMVVDGGSGIDTLSIAQPSDQPVAIEFVDMAQGAAQHGQSTISFSGIENLGVGAQATVYGDDAANVIQGASPLGATLTRGDIFYGRGGDDTLIGSGIGDFLDGGDGNDTLDGGGGINTLVGGAGIDTAIIHTSFAKADVMFAAGHTDIRTPDGSVQQTYQVEIYKFDDLTVTEADGKPLVDDLYYLFHNRDVAAAGFDADDHYNRIGWHEGRDPNAYFSTNGYLNANPDVRGAGINPLDHYDQSGWKEGRDPSLNFDTSLYLAHNPDVAAAGIDPLTHYLQFGLAEGRQAYAAIGTHLYADGFDPEYYLMANPDVATAAFQSGGDTSAFAYQHYETIGWKEGRNPNAWFDDKGYLAAYQDVADAGVNPLDHYDQFGWKEGRDPSTGFDTDAYLGHYTDVAAAGVDPLVHYLTSGAYELRSTFGDGAFHI